MDDLKSLIPVSYDNPERPTVSGRELHEFLQVDSNYTTWFKRMCEYGFTEGEDYVPILENRSDGLAGKPRTDHQLTIPMAKELCMIQRNERGKQAGSGHAPCGAYRPEAERPAQGHWPDAKHRPQRECGTDHI